MPLASDAESSTVTTERLELVLLPASVLAGVLAGQPVTVGFADPSKFLVGAHDVVALRLAQLEANPAIGPWLLRAIVLRDPRVAIGFIGFHAEPDARGMVELGYEIQPAYRRHGYASEAVAGLVAWAADHGAQVARASIGPQNAASIALVLRHGFAMVGEQTDEEDGLELVFERALAT